MNNSTNKRISDKVAGKIAGAIFWIQAGISDRMNKLKHLKIILIAFCIISGGLSIYVFTDAVIHKPKQKMKIDQIRRPRMIDEYAKEMYDSKVPDEIYRQIQEYRRYMDSSGQSIRAGLADSMKVLEEMYLQQQK